MRRDRAGRVSALYKSYADGYAELNRDRVAMGLSPLPIHEHLTLLTPEFDRHVSRHAVSAERRFVVLVLPHNALALFVHRENERRADRLQSSYPPSGGSGSRKLVNTGHSEPAFTRLRRACRIGGSVTAMSWLAYGTVKGSASSM